MIPPLSNSYVDARAAFLDAAAGVGASIESFAHPDARGIDGEELFVDVAEIAPAEGGSGDVVIVVSGTHGVEGYLGSALQRHHLETLDRDRVGGPTLVFVHALNPFGFSWVRRTNEDNVDLNRNFIDWSQPTPDRPGYAEIADLLVPGSWDQATQDETRRGLAIKLGEVGIEGFQQIVSGGQWSHPTGLFYGGSKPAWSQVWLREYLGRRLTGVARAAIVDLHTGLGEWGTAELISSNPVDSEAYLRQAAWWDDVVSFMDDKSVSASLSGDWLAVADELAPDTEITGIAIEYGVVDPIQVLEGLRADAVLHAGGDPTAPEAAAIRAQIRAVFNDDDPAWLEACWPVYRTTVTTALERLA